jgi:hypothetical protein
MAHYVDDVTFHFTKTLHCTVSTSCVVEPAGVVPRVKRERGRAQEEKRRRLRRRRIS